MNLSTLNILLAFFLGFIFLTTNELLKILCGE